MVLAAIFFRDLATAREHDDAAARDRAASASSPRSSAPFFVKLGANQSIMGAL